MKKTFLLLIVFIFGINAAKSQVRKDTILPWNNCKTPFITSVLESFPPKYSFIPQEPDSMGQYHWDFGDGSSSDEMYAVHEYAYSGIYLVSVYYISEDSCTAFALDTVYVTGHKACEAKWYYYIDQMPDISPQPFISFMDESMGNITKWQWDFGDSTSASERNASHLYAEDGVYHVCLTITTSDNCTSTYCQLVNTKPFIECNITGTVRDYTGLDGCGLVIVLDDDSTVLEPAEIVPNFVLKDGQRVRLSYTILDDRASICMVGPIVRIDCITPIMDDSCFIDFNFFPVPWVSSWPPIYRFEPIPDMFIKEILWNFGDGTTSTEEIPNHRFPHDGYYTVNMKMKNYMGCEADIYKTAYFEGYDEQPGLCYNYIKLSTEVILNGHACNGTATASLVDESGNHVDASAYLWSTGDTTSFVSQLCPGVLYHVLITDLGGCGVSGSFSFGNEYYPDTLIGYWNYEQDAFDFHFSLPVFSDSLRCEWDFGDGEQAEGETVNHTYDTPALYTVVLRVKDDEGNILYSENILVSAGNPTAANKKESEPPEVYPVPASDHLNIVLSNHLQAKQIEIITAGGQTMQIVTDINQNHNRIEMNISELLSGFYIGKIQFENGQMQTFRFIK